MSEVNRGIEGIELILSELGDNVAKLLAEHTLLRPLVTQLVLADAVSGELLNDDQRAQALKNFADQRGIQSEQALETYCRANFLSPESLVNQAEIPLRVHQHCQKYYKPKAEARFLQRKDQLDRVVYSLLRLKHAGLARELFLQLQDGEASFADLAATYSDGPEKTTRGVIGPVPLNQAHPSLAKRLRTSAIGELQEPFQIDQWWLLLRVESFWPAIFDESMASQMSQELFQQWLEQQVDQLFENLHSRVLAKSPQQLT